MGIEGDLASMADPQLTDAALLVSDNSAEPLNDEPKINAEYLDISVVQQIILKIVQSATESGSPIPCSQPTPVISTEVAKAMQRLLQIISELRSPTSGWPDDLPQTPEAIAPYILNEIQDVLEALQPVQIPSNPDEKTLTKDFSKTLLQKYFAIREIEPWLLWWVARSAYEVMGLLEGVSARVLESSRGWQTGILRLVTMLKIDLPRLSQSLDLVTHQPLPSLLPDNTLVQLPDYALYRQPKEVENLTQTLVTQIRATSPLIGQFMDGVQVNALVPQQYWQTGSIQLRLGFEFIADITEVATPDNPGLDMAIPAEFTLRDGTNSSKPFTPIVIFTDPEWLERYRLAIAQQQIARSLPKLPVFAAIQKSRLLLPDDCIPDLVQDACELAALLQNSPIPAHRNFLQQPLRLDDLLLRVLWCFNCSAYEVMQLMSGMRAKILEPGQNWQTGILRFLVSLTVKTPELEWCLDLATGRGCKSPSFLVPKQAIAHAKTHPWCQQPELLEHLEAKIMKQVWENTPEIQLLLEGTNVDLLSAEEHWQSAVLQLGVEFEFISN
jgi:NTP pyrophosphatase (non-canonical NTP hydrolase)